MGRPSSRPTGQVGALLDDWKAEEAAKSAWGKGPSDEDLAKRIGVSDSMISDWRRMRSQLLTWHMSALVKITGVPLSAWAVAAESDLPTVMEHLSTRTTRSGQPSSGQRKRQQLDDLGEEPQ